jgi:hypothetical protein
MSIIMCTQYMNSHNLYLVSLLTIAVIYFLSARMDTYNERRVAEGFGKKYTPIKAKPLPLPDLGFLMQNPLQSLIDFFNRLNNLQDILGGAVAAFNKAKELAEKGYKEAVAQYNNTKRQLTNSVNQARNKMNNLKNKAAAKAIAINNAVKDRAKKVANQAKNAGKRAGKAISGGAKKTGRTISRGAKKFFR